MSKSQLQIVFEHEDRGYHFGEQISGKVILNALDKLTYRKIWIDYGWRTHGEGNRDECKKTILILHGEESHLSKGEQRVYYFKFAVPNGPVTYHGMYINVDWYLAAHADIPFARNLNHEEDFLLLGSKAPKEINPGDKTPSKIQLPAHQRTIQSTNPVLYDDPLSPVSRSPLPTAPITLTIITILSVLGIFAFLMYLQISWFVALIISVIAGMLIFGGTNLALLAISRLKLDIREIWITPADVYTGGELNLHLRFMVKGEIFLESIATLLTAEEQALSGGGTNVSTFKFIVYQDSTCKPYNETLLAERWVTFDRLLDVPCYAPASFTATNNKVIWSLKVVITLKRWPSWEKTIPLTVLPA